MTDPGTDRGVSITLSYVTLLGVAAMVTTGLVIVGGDLAEDQRDRAIEDQFNVIGEQLSSDLAVADRLVRTHDTDTVRLERQFPQRVAGSTYDVTIDTSPEDVNAPAALQLSATRSDVVVEVAIETGEAVDTSSQVDGGNVIVEWDSGANQLVILDG